MEWHFGNTLWKYDYCASAGLPANILTHCLVRVRSKNQALEEQEARKGEAHSGLRF